MARAGGVSRDPFSESFPAEERARQRLAYDEFFVLQCVVALRRLSRNTAHRQRHSRSTDSLTQRWLASLPYALTNAQRRVMGEIDADLSQGPPMTGCSRAMSGRERRSWRSTRCCARSRRAKQAALMAPTQILAEQHALNLRAWLEPLGIRVDLFTGNTKGKGKKADRLQGGELDLFCAEEERYWTAGPAEGRLRVGYLEERRFRRGRHARLALRPLPPPTSWVSS